MWFAYIFKADAAVATLHIGGIFTQVGGADVFDTVRQGAALAALNHGIVADAPDLVIETL